MIPRARRALLRIVIEHHVGVAIDGAESLRPASGVRRHLLGQVEHVRRMLLGGRELLARPHLFHRRRLTWWLRTWAAPRSRGFRVIVGNYSTDGGEDLLHRGF